MNALKTATEESPEQLTRKAYLEGVSDAYKDVFEILNAISTLGIPTLDTRAIIIREAGLNSTFAAELMALPPKPGVRERIKDPNWMPDPASAAGVHENGKLSNKRRS